MKEQKKPVTGEIRLLERVITKDGERIIAEVSGNSPEGLAIAEKFSVDHLKATPVPENGEGKPGRSSFGITNWEHCGWNPKGPKPIWATPPENPSNN